MLVLEFGKVVDILVNDYPQTVRLVVRRNVRGGEDLGHDDGKRVGEIRDTSGIAKVTRRNKGPDSAS